MTTTKHPPHMGTMSQVPFNLSFLLNRGYTIQPNNQIIEKTETGYYSLTYLQHQARVCQLANALTKHGVKRGDRVGLFYFHNQIVVIIDGDCEM